MCSLRLFIFNTEPRDSQLNGARHCRLMRAASHLAAPTVPLNRLAEADRRVDVRATSCNGAIREPVYRIRVTSFFLYDLLGFSEGCECRFVYVKSGMPCTV